MHADSLEMAWISETHGYSLAQIAALAGTSEELGTSSWPWATKASRNLRRTFCETQSDMGGGD